MILGTRSTNLSDVIFDDLLRQILQCDIEAGAKLPPERELASAYDTNRNTLREAIRKLDQAGLVSVRQGDGVRIKDYRRSGNLALLRPYLSHSTDHAERTRIITELLTFRVTVIEMAVRLAAQRATPSDVARLESVAEQQLQHFENQDRIAIAAGDLKWLDAIVEASHSLTVRWIANSVLEIYADIIEQAPGLWLFEESFPHWVNAVCSAIKTGDGLAGTQATHNYFEAHDSQLGDLVAALTAMLWPPKETSNDITA